jgi:hypothetical protein
MSDEITLGCRVRIRDEVVARDLQGETAILHLGSGVFFGLDPMATRVWQLLAAHAALREVLAALLEEYDVTEDRCRRDLIRFVRALHDNDLVTLETPSPA